MRRTALLILLACLALPSAALAARAATTDGTLSVRNGDGQVRLALERGVAIGRIGFGQLVVVDPASGDCSEPLVWEDGERAEPIVRDAVLPTKTERELRCIFNGIDMRFRLGGPEGSVVRISGTSISLSAVGKGSGRVKGLPFDIADGTYSANGEAFGSMPDEWKVFQLPAPS
jgi:hypothetical protein